MEASTPRTRIAPTPSGYLHLGNAFNFLLTYLWTRQQGGSLGLRIDDGDATRSRTEYLEDIFESLEWLGIVPDWGPSGVTEHQHTHSQQLRQDAYREAVEHLMDAQKAYACKCSRKEIQARNAKGQYPGTCRSLWARAFQEPHALRAALPEKDAWVQVKDFQGQALPVNLLENQSDFVLWRKDGLAAYHLVSVWEDEQQGITHWVRGQDLWDSTVAQLWLAQTLGYTQVPKVRAWHHPLLMGGGNLKLSKSAGATSLRRRREAGQPVRVVYEAFPHWLGLPAVPISSLPELEAATAHVDWARYALA